MFVISPVSALHSSASHPHYNLNNHYAAPRPSPRDRYLAAIAQAEADYARAQAVEEQQRAEAYARRQHQENMRHQLILDAIRARGERQYARDYSDFEYAPVYGYPANLKRPYGYSEHAQKLAERRARERQAALEHVAREREARMNEWKRLVAHRQQEEARRAQEEAQKFANMFTRPRAVEPKQQPKRETVQRREDAEGTPLKNRLESRLMNEYEFDIRDTLKSLLDSLAPSQSAPAAAAPATESTETVAPVTVPVSKDTKGKSKQVSFSLPSDSTTAAAAAASDSETDSEVEATTDPAFIQSSLSAIDEIGASFRALESEFEFPEELDFDRSADGSELKLAYSSRNAPLRFYDNALSQLLSRLDAIPSHGSRNVRDARKMMVRRVEKVLEDTEREVERKKEVAAWKAAKTNASATVEGEKEAMVEMKPEELARDDSTLAEPTQTSEPESILASPPSSSTTTDTLSPVIATSSILPDVVINADEPSADPILIQSVDGSTIEAPSSAPDADSALTLEDERTSEAEPREADVVLEVAQENDADMDAAYLPIDLPAPDLSVPLDEAPRVDEASSVSIPVDEPTPIEVDQPTTPALGALYSLEDLIPIDTLPEPELEAHPESVPAPTTSEPSLTPITTDISSSRTFPEDDEPVASPASADSPVPAPAYPPAPVSLSFSYPQPIATEIEPRSPSTESSLSLSQDEPEQEAAAEAVREDDVVEVDTYLLAPSSPSSSPAPSPAPSSEGDDSDIDAVLIDPEHEDDAWSEVSS